MKKIIYLLLALPLIALLGSCDKEELIFDHERPQFEIRENAILLEMIMPEGSPAEDEYYITGPFNSGEAAIGNLEWKLEKAENSNIKWGIYLIPSTFQDGKTLADGFTFYSMTQGAERSVNNEEVTHTLNVGIGTRTNVWVDRWESYFGGVEKDSYSVYVVDNSGWDALALYAWGPDGDVTPAWPGLLPTEEVIGGVTYKVFDMGAELKGVTMNLIFNNNNGGSQLDGPQDFTLNADLYVELTSSGYEIIDPGVAPYNGYTVYVEDNSGWGALALYGWNDGDVTPAWPGLLPTGTRAINGVTYTYFEWGEELNGQVVNMIFNDNGGGNQFDAVQGFTIDRDLYLRITGNSFEEIDPNQAPYSGYYVYADNQTGWEAVALYAHGEAETPAWPGLQPAGTAEVNGVTYIAFEMGENMSDKAINLIFNNNNNGEQLADVPVTLSENLYFRLTPEGAEQVDPNAGEPRLITLVLKVPAYTPANSDIRLYGNVNGWNGSDARWRAVMDENDPTTYRMTLDMNCFAASLTEEFKFGLMMEGQEWWYFQSNTDGSEGETTGFSLEADAVEGQTYNITIVGWSRHSELPQ